MESIVNTLTTQRFATECSCAGHASSARHGRTCCLFPDSAYFATLGGESVVVAMMNKNAKTQGVFCVTQSTFNEGMHICKFRVYESVDFVGGA